MRLRELKLLLFAVAIFSLSACGSAPADRTLSGAGIGAAAGAVVGGLIGGPLGGVLLGGVAGAATGALTDQQDINLGEPVWKDPFWE